jgi:DNA polymerase-4/protein ImuB
VRAACILFPHFAVSLEVLRRPELHGRPLVLGGLPEERRAVLDCSPEAEREGISLDMQLREALSRCHQAVFLEPDHAHYNAISERVLDALELLSPLVEETGPGCFLVGLAGLERLHRDERELARRLQASAWEAAGLLPRVGVAGGRFAARVAATLAPDAPQRPVRHVRKNASRTGDTFGWRPLIREIDRLEGNSSSLNSPSPFTERGPGGEAGIHIVEEDRLHEFLARLPVQELPVSPGMKRRLRLFGLETLGDVSKLPLGAMQAQFGPQGRLAWQLARGIDESTFCPRHKEEGVRETIAFPAPSASLESIQAAARNLLSRLLRREELLRRSARRIALSARLSDGHVWERAVTLREPTADRDRLLLALGAKLEGCTLPNPVEEITLELSGLCAERGRQEGMFAAKGRRTNQLEDAIRQLKSRYGTSPVSRVVEVEPWSRIPERRRALIDYDP